MVFELTTDQFHKEVLENNLPSVVAIYTLRCPKCKVIAPIFNETAAANNGKYSFFKLNDL